LAAGAVARKLLKHIGVTFNGKILELAGIEVSNEKSLEKARKKALMLGKKGDSTGGIVEIIIKGVPSGIGSPVFGKLQAELGRAFLTIGGVKGIENGLGFAAARAKGSESNDPFRFGKNGKVETVSNNCGGILGGISTGSDLVFRLAVKPTPTIAVPQKTVNVSTEKAVKMEYQGRFDRNFTPRIIPIAEAMAACVIADQLIMNGVIPAGHI